MTESSSMCSGQRAAACHRTNGLGWTRRGGETERTARLCLVEQRDRGTCLDSSSSHHIGIGGERLVHGRQPRDGAVCFLKQGVGEKIDGRPVLTAHHPITYASGPRDWFIASGWAACTRRSRLGSLDDGRPRILRKCGLSLQTANLPPCKSEIEQASHGDGDGMGWRGQPASPWLLRTPRKAPYLACRGSLARDEIMCDRGGREDE